MPNDDADDARKVRPGIVCNKREKRKIGDVPVAVERRSGVCRATQKGERLRKPTPTKNRFYSPAGAELTADEIEFGGAMSQFKKHAARPCPSWSDVVDVLESIGYQRDDGPDAATSATPALLRLRFAAFMQAYKRDYQRPFPMWSEVLAVAKAFGFRKPAMV